MKKGYIFLIIGWFIILLIFILKGWTPSYEAKLIKVDAHGVNLFMKEDEITSLLGAKDPTQGNCMGCEPNMDYQKLGLFLRVSETEDYVSHIRITNPEYSIAGIHPNQGLKRAQKLLEKINFTQTRSDSYHYFYQKGKYIIHLSANEQKLVASIEVEYEIDKDKQIMYKRVRRLAS